jgi:hypothetical protein
MEGLDAEDADYPAEDVRLVEVNVDEINRVLLDVIDRPPDMNSF